jgi:ABC-2 type transport system ATP-binding protein
MLQLDQTGTCPAGIAVKVSGVSKVFTQKQPPISIRDLFSPRRKIIKALDAVSFTINYGELVAYAGPNGAGKSTTIKLLGGMLAQNSGDISVLGMSPLKNRIPLMRKLGVLFGNRTELWWDHPVSSSYRWKRKVWDIPKKNFDEMEALVLELLDIRPFYQTFARELSLGQRMRADLGMMLLHKPSLILLDEPTLGLDVLAKRQMIGFLKSLNEQQGTTIIVTSHDMDDLEEMTRRILLISEGKIAFDGGFTELRNELGCAKRVAISFQDGTHRELVYEDMGKLISELSRMGGIEEINFTQTSLEEGLANLFAKWNNN